MRTKSCCTLLIHVVTSSPRQVAHRLRFVARRSAQHDDALGDRVTSLEQLLGGNDSRDEAHLCGFGGVDVAAGEHDLERP
jgi:hypothetical protein